MKIETISDMEMGDLSELYLIDRLLTRQAVGILYAKDYSGKSYLTMALIAIALQTGKFIDRDCKIKKVAYVSGEGNHDLVLRLQALQAYYGDLPELHIIRDFESEINLYVRPSMMMLANTLQENCEFDQYDLVVFDTLNAFSEGFSESNATDTAKLKSNIRLFCSMTNASVLLIHHSTKVKYNGEDSDLDDKLADFRGSSAISAMADLMMYIHNGKLCCRKVKSGDEFTDTYFSFEKVANSSVVKFGDYQKPLQQSTLELIKQSLIANPSLANLTLVKMHINPNAKRTTQSQVNLINTAKIEIAAMSSNDTVDNTDNVEIDDTDNIIDDDELPVIIDDNGEEIPF